MYHLLSPGQLLIHVSEASSRRSPETHLSSNKLGLLVHCNKGETHLMGNMGGLRKRVLGRTCYRIGACLSDLGRRVQGSWALLWMGYCPEEALTLIVILSLS